MGISNCCLNLQEMTKLGICLCHKLRKKLIDASLTNKEESRVLVYNDTKISWQNLIQALSLTRLI